MEIPHDREHVEHLLCGVRGPSPVLSTEGDLGDLLSCAEAVVDSAAPETLLPQACMNGASEVGLQMWTSMPGGLGDCEVCRR